jgi:hypothetical protein
MRPTLLTAAVLSIALAGCAAPAHDDGCVERTVVLHEVRAGAYVATNRCTGWSFGPTRSQQEEWQRNERKVRR